VPNTVHVLTKFDNAVGLNLYHLAGATPATSDVLGPQFIAAPQQQGVFMPPCFTFRSGSPPNDEAEQQAMDCFKPSQHDDLANAFSSTFNGLSLRNDHPGSGSSAMAVEAASLDTSNVFLCSACSGRVSYLLKVNYFAVRSLVLNVLATFLPYCF
jgi:hypothetical protein